MKRQVLIGLLGALALAGSAAVASAEQSTVTLRVANYGGLFTDAQRKYVADILTQRTGIKVEYIDGNPVDHLAKMVASKGREAPFDVVYLDDSVQEQAITAGVLEKFDSSKVPNYKFLYDEAKSKAGYGPAMIFYSVGIAYNTQKFSEAGIPAITSWQDLWNPKLAGHVAVPTLSNTMGMALLVAAEQISGGNEGTPDKGIAKIATLKASSYPTASSQVQALMSAGDAWVVPWMNGRSWQLIDSGMPVKYVLPKEGAYAGTTTIDLVRGTTHEKEALAYINMVLDPLPQLGQAYAVPYGPVTKVLAPVLKDYPEMAQKFPSSPDDIAKLKEINWPLFNKNYRKAVDLWNREVANK